MMFFRGTIAVNYALIFPKKEHLACKICVLLIR